MRRFCLKLEGVTVATRILKFWGLICLSILLSGCAGVLPVPGGSDTINKSFYETDEIMKKRIAGLYVGMHRDQAFEYLKRTERDFLLLGRNEVLSALYGGAQATFKHGYDSPLANQGLLQSLTGYKLIFKNVKRKHGISSPIAMRTNETGFSYSTILIFQDNYLFEKPVVSGGAVDASSTKTVFDYLSPQSVIGRLAI